MKSSSKKKGGKRKGAGRKPSGAAKEAVTVYTDVSRFGGKEGARMAIYEFLDGKINFTGKSSFVPLDQEIKQRAPEEQKKHPQADLKPQEQPKSKFEEAISEAAKMQIMADIEAIKAERIPKERDTVYGRKSWQMDRQKRIQELLNKLK